MIEVERLATLCDKSTRHFVGMDIGRGLADVLVIAALCNEEDTELANCFQESKVTIPKSVELSASKMLSITLMLLYEARYLISVMDYRSLSKCVSEILIIYNIRLAWTDYSEFLKLNEDEIEGWAESVIRSWSESIKMVIKFDNKQ